MKPRFVLGALGRVMTGRWRAVIHFVQARVTRETVGAYANESVHGVGAGGSVVTRRRGAFVRVDIAAFSLRGRGE